MDSDLELIRFSSWMPTLDIDDTCKHFLERTLFTNSFCNGGVPKISWLKMYDLLSIPQVDTSILVFHCHWQLVSGRRHSKLSIKGTTFFHVRHFETENHFCFQDVHRSLATDGQCFKETVTSFLHECL